MFSDEDSSAPATPSTSGMSMPKWPFLLGDLVLVAAALALWATQAPLSPLQTLVALGALGLGAVLFIIPFVMDFTTRAQLRGLELEQARAEDYQRLSALDAEMRKQARTAAESQEHAARATAALENLARKLDARLAPLEAVQKSLESASAGFQEAIAIQATMEHDDLERRQGQLEKLSVAVTAIAAAIKKLDALADQPPPGPDPATVATLETIQERLEIMAHLLAQFRLPEPDIGLPSESMKKKPDAGGSMLAKALSTAQTNEETPAVARIIESRPRKPRKTKSPAPETETSPPPDTVNTATTDSPSETPADTLESPPTEVLEEPLSEAASPEPEPAVEPATELPSSQLETRNSKPETLEPPAQAELLDTGAETTRRRRSAKTVAPAATLVARVLIGIGNKPYIRGDGPGLSHSKGVPMEFVEIGQWRWVAPSSTTDAISVRILKNDEVPAEGGPITLQPGQTLEVSPEFPG
jgi:hypothetical protein